MEIEAGSLFSGIGGFDLALTNCGMKIMWQVEIDKQCNSVMEKQFPNVERFEDIRKCGRHNLKPVDLICGGFPCQDLSVSGRRQGLAGERSGLWFEFARIIEELEPRWIVIENVPGLLSSKKGKDFAVIIQWLAERGYGVAWRVLDAQYFGVPQRRRRVFIVGHLGDGRAAQVLFERESGNGYFTQGREAGKEIARPLVSCSTTDHYDDSQQTYIVNTITQNPANRLSAEDNYIIVEQNNKVSLPDKFSLRANPAQPLLVGPLQSGSKKHGHSMATQQAAQAGQLIAFSAGQSAGAYGIAADDKVAPPIRSGESGTNRVPTIAWRGAQTVGTLHSGFPGRDASDAVDNKLIPEEIGVRRLTPAECEKLQGFPCGWTGGQSDSARYRQMGNAVAIPCVEWIGRRIVEVKE